MDAINFGQFSSFGLIPTFLISITLNRNNIQKRLHKQ